MHFRKRSLALLVPLSLALGACSEAPVTGVTADAAEPRLAPAPACVEFNVPALGTTYGSIPGPAFPGGPVFVESGIVVGVAPFTTGASTFYAEAKIEFPPLPFGAGQTGRARSISWTFDFTGLPFVPSTVAFEWLDQGANSIENLAVNGSPVWVGQIFAPPAAFGPVSVFASSVAVPNGRRGSIKLVGPVQKHLVGGQPLWVDRLCAYP